MICSNCKTEMEDGLVYCPICGKANQIVPDYNLLEDDILPSMVGKKPKYEIGPDGTMRPVAEPVSKKKFNLKYVIVPLIVIMLLTLIFIMNSSPYMLFMASDNENAGNYENAVSYYLRAKDKGDDLEALIGLGRCYRSMNDPTQAKKYLQEALVAHGDDSEAFEELIITYEALSDYEGMTALSSLITTDEQKKIYETHHITPPDFSVAGGVYNDDIELVLSSADGFDVFYTIDGTDPNSANGRIFKNKLMLKEGVTTVKAVCKNNEGKFGSIKYEVYDIKYEMPERPVASPMTGVFRNPMSVTLTTNVPEGVIYYTWDGSDPSVSSRKYEGALKIPEGDNVLSAIVVDKHGISSEVTRCSYSYLPKKAVETKEKE